MPHARIDDTLDMFYELDNFVEPWKQPETVLLVHGIGGCTTEWFAWVPALAAKYAVLRVDLRGWGKSTVPPEGYKWSMANFAEDLVKLLDELGLQKVHFVGIKLGGRIGLHFARHHAERLHSLTLITTPMELQNLNSTRQERPQTADGRAGVERWARRSMPERIGKVIPEGQVPPEMMEWWIELYSSQSPRVTSEVFDLAWDTFEYDLLSTIKVPTLVVDHNGFRDIESICKWQVKIAGSKLAVIPVTNQGRQISASMPKETSAAVLEFLGELAVKKLH